MKRTISEISELIPMSETSIMLKPLPTVLTDTGSPAPRLHFIDGMRGLAMVMVLMCHCWIFGGFWVISLPGGSHNAASLFSYGYIGVNLFLVISGFCLYWPFVKGGTRRETTLWEFAKKRCRRILPPYYVALALFGAPLLLQAVRHHSEADLGFAVNWLLLHIFMLHNLNLDYVVRVDGALWTLALEFQLYILFPVLVEAYRRFNPRGVLLIVLLFTCLYRLVVTQAAMTSAGDVPDYAAGFVLTDSVFGRCFEFALGMFAAIVVSRWHTEQKSPLRGPDYLLAAAVVLLSFVSDKQGYFAVLSDARWGLLAAALLLAGSRPAKSVGNSVSNFVHRVLSSRVLVSLGIFSYSVYLIHQPLVILLGKFGMRHFTNTKMVLYEIFFVAPLMILVGYVFHLLFERPFMNAPRAKAPAVPMPPAVAVQEFVREETSPT
jgi:peptidoglycan/LPS O-acetylase OafA/YrhL